MKKLNGKKISLYPKTHIKAINVYDKRKNNIQNYNIEKIMKIQKTTKNIIYFDYIEMKKIQKYKDENNYSWFYVW